MATSEGALSIKSLASCNTTLRSKALKQILTWLPTADKISEDDLKKLWKGLFYCVWHCDKIQNQTRLINRITSLLPFLPAPLALSYFNHFLLTIRREWPGIDNLRLDKFYLLIRVFIRELFVLLKKGNWDLDIVDSYVRVLEDRIFYVVDEKGLGNGVGYHIVSVFLPEIKPFLPLNLDVLNVLFRPFVSVLGNTGNKVLVSKVKREVFDYLLKNGKALLDSSKSGTEINVKDEIHLFGTIALVMGFAKRFFDLGSSPDCVQGNRKVLFGLHEQFLKLEKEMQSSGNEIPLPQMDAGDDDEVPQLIPVTKEVNFVHNMEEDKAEKPSKKNKKDKKASKGKYDKKKKQKKEVGDKGITNGGSDGNADKDMTAPDGDSSILEAGEDGDSPMLSESAISNLQKQFEKIAAEAGLEGDGASLLDPPTNQANGKALKKRKRSKSLDGKKIKTVELENTGVDDALKTGEKSTKKVKFSMKNNLVWKPHNPLPPQSLRIPPSVTPRGSALKRGLRPGPIKEPTPEKARKKSGSLKKRKKALLRMKKKSMSA